MANIPTEPVISGSGNGHEPPCTGDAPSAVGSSAAKRCVRRRSGAFHLLALPNQRGRQPGRLRMGFARPLLLAAPEVTDTPYANADLAASSCKA